MEKLHSDIVENILRRLPIEAAVPAKQVCKTWRILLRSKTDKVGLLFVESYMKTMEEKNKLYYGDEYDPVRGKMNYNYSYDRLDLKMLKEKATPSYMYMYMDNILGSCNGLVCMRGLNMIREKLFLICNPFTGEVVYIPKPNDESIAPDGDATRVSGFGYCNSTNEYKIVRMYSDIQGHNRQFLVHTIAGGWRRSRSKAPPVYISTWFPSVGVYANGYLHWLFSNDLVEPQKGYMIMTFDLEDEKLKFIDLPHLNYDHQPNLLNLLGGDKLYLVYMASQSLPGYTYIWTYKRENAKDKNSWGWIKEFSIEWEMPFSKKLVAVEPLLITRNNEFLLRYGCTTLFCYDLKTSTVHTLFESITGCYMINVIPHANTIVSMASKDEEVKDHQYRTLRKFTGEALGKFRCMELFSFA